MDRRLIEWHPLIPNLFQVCSNKLELYEVFLSNGDRNIRMVKNVEGHDITCMEFYPHQCDNSTFHAMTCFGDITGSVFLFDWMTGKETNITVGKAGIRGVACTGISWNKVNKNQLAAGFDKLRNEHSAVVIDIEYGSFFKDRNKEEIDRSKKFLLGEAVSSIVWLPSQANLFLTGTSRGWIRLCDVVTGKSEMSIKLNESDKISKVKGIRVDPFHENLIAAFSDTPGDDIKIFDIRKIGGAMNTKESSSLVCSIRSPCSTSTVSDVAWSPYRTGVIAVASSSMNYIPIYNVANHHNHIHHHSHHSHTKSEEEGRDRLVCSPLHRIAIPDACKALSWRDTWKSSSHIVTSENLLTDACTSSATTISSSSSTISTTPHRKQSQNRMLIAMPSGIIDHEVCERLALGYSPAHAATLTTSSSTCINTDTAGFVDCNVLSQFPLLPQKKSSTDSSQAKGDAIDIDSLIRRRAKCGYSFDSGRNCQMFSDELDHLKSIATRGKGDHDTVQSTQDRVLSIYRVWEWINRIELSHEEADFTVCGIDRILSLSSSITSTVSGTASIQSLVVHPILGIHVFLSEQRETARKICGWTIIHGLKSDSKGDNKDEETLIGLVDQVEDMGCFERSALLAVWHGNLPLAIEILRRNTESHHHEPDNEIEEEENNDEEVQSEEGDGQGGAISESYKNMISIVAMCIAGFSGNTDSSNVSSRAMWSSMCEHVIQLLLSMLCKRQATSFLVVLCKFLLACLQKTLNFSFVLSDAMLPYEDKLAFACTYLKDEYLNKWINDLLLDSKRQGNLEGLIISGLSKDGIEILQTYLDASCDIQTCALIACRIINKRLNKADLPTFEWICLYEYRNWLNKCQLFTERAKLDVELGKYQRQRQTPVLPSTASTSVNASTSAKAKGTSAGPSSAAASTQKAKAKSSRQWYSAPLHCEEPHVLLRCHYCTQSLPPDMTQQHQQAAYLRKQKPIINSCPNCKKQLPRCYVCQLYMGLVNPHLELNKILAQRRNQLERYRDPSNNISIEQQQAGSSASITNANAHSNANEYSNVMELGQWIFFCQRCKHGGHANCLKEWFRTPDSLSSAAFDDTGGCKSRDVCGVNGCSCQCLHLT